MTDPLIAAEPHSPNVPHALTGGLTALGLVAALYAAVTVPNALLAFEAKLFMVIWLGLSVACTFILTPRNFTFGYLGALLCMLGGWRVAGLLGVSLVSWPLLLAFVAFAAQFFDAACADLARRPSSLLSVADWHLTFIRIYVGFDMVPHFTEKLFAGPGPRLDDTKAFAEFGLPFPEGFVLLGGLCELGIAIGIGAGLLTRLAGVCAALYFFIATAVGGHFFSGFIWASPGGGWEYPLLMMVLYLSYAVYGAGRFSFDRILMDAGLMPTPLRICAIKAA